VDRFSEGVTLEGVAIDTALRRGRNGEKQQERNTPRPPKHEIQSTGYGICALLRRSKLRLYRRIIVETLLATSHS
jgi:hypothetical protein